MKKWITSSLMLTLAACAAPTAKTPDISQAELAQEIAREHDFVNQQQLKKQQHALEKKAEMETRLARVGSRIMEGGVRLCPFIAHDKSKCLFQFHLQDGHAINAYADGGNIFITPAMMNFLKNDDELAVILGHEYAHNLMGHIAAQHENQMAGMLVGTTLDVLAAVGGFGTGSLFSNAGSQIGALSYSQQFESEADYIGLYIAANSGFDISDAADIWRRLSLKDPKLIDMATTHPTNPHRFLAMNKTIAEIEGKEQRSEPLIPKFKPKKQAEPPVVTPRHMRR